MGAGQGKTRRAQQAQPANKEAVHNKPEKWEEFIKNSGLTSAKLHQYYLKNTPKPLTHEDYNKLMNELFADCVAVGAITLPNPYEAKDFEFKVRINNSPKGFAGANITLKGSH